MSHSIFVDMDPACIETCPYAMAVGIDAAQVALDNHVTVA